MRQIPAVIPLVLIARMFGLVLGLTLALPVAARPVAYGLDPAGSTVGFVVAFGASPLRGSMPVTKADLLLDFDAVANSRVAVTLSSRGATMGFPFAAEALKSPGVLDAARHPTLRFQSTRVRANGDGAQIEGNLTVRGVTRPVILQAVIWRQQGSAVGNRDRLTIRLTGTLSRADFGATGWPNMVGDAVALDISARIHATR